MGLAGPKISHGRLGVDCCVQKLLLKMVQPAPQIDILPLGCDAVLPEADLGPQKELFTDGLHVLVRAS